MLNEKETVISPEWTSIRQAALAGVALFIGNLTICLVLIDLEFDIDRTEFALVISSHTEFTVLWLSSMTIGWVLCLLVFVILAISTFTSGRSLKPETFESSSLLLYHVARHRWKLALLFG
jgi:hypothetical protein